jgi:hypothetical protein
MNQKSYIFDILYIQNVISESKRKTFIIEWLDMHAYGNHHKKKLYTVFSLFLIHPTQGVE